MHRVKISSAVTPVRQKLRCLPFSVRDAVSEEIHRLLDLGIIERVDALPWVSPIVVVQKKLGAIRMCVDLREPNKAVVMDSYPLPHTEDLLSCGVTFFHYRFGECLFIFERPFRIKKSMWQSTFFKALEVKPNFAPAVIACCSNLS